MKGDKCWICKCVLQAHEEVLCETCVVNYDINPIKYLEVDNILFKARNKKLKKDMKKIKKLNARLQKTIEEMEGDSPYMWWF